MLRFARPGTTSKRIGGNLKNLNMRCSKSLIQTDLGSSAELLSDGPGARETRLRQKHRANYTISQLRCNFHRPTVLSVDLEVALGGARMSNAHATFRQAGVDLHAIRGNLNNLKTRRSQAHTRHHGPP